MDKLEPPTGLRQFVLIEWSDYTIIEMVRILDERRNQP